MSNLYTLAQDPWLKGGIPSRNNANGRSSLTAGKAEGAYLIIDSQICYPTIPKDARKLRPSNVSIPVFELKLVRKVFLLSKGHAAVPCSAGAPARRTSLDHKIATGSRLQSCGGLTGAGRDRELHTTLLVLTLL